MITTVPSNPSRRLGRRFSGVTATLLVLVASAGLPAQKLGKTVPWAQFPGGVSAPAAAGDLEFRTTLGDEELGKIAARVFELRPFYEAHFGDPLGKGWSVTVLTDIDQYNIYAKEVTKGNQNVQGECLRARKEVVIANSKRYGWLSTLSHEYAHAYYECNGAIWLREGVASLVEVCEFKGGKIAIPVNRPRLNGLRQYQEKGHYESISLLLKGENEPGGYGYSYEHGWSVHYFLYTTDAKKYRTFLAEVRKKTGRDISAEVYKAFGMSLNALDTKWKEFVKGLKD